MASTNVAGKPESYFREPDEQLWADRWDVGRSPDGAFEFADYVTGALAAGRTENGVFAARIMWGTMDHLVDRLGTVHPPRTGGDLDLLDQAFGHTAFIHLRREDVLAQAVSWCRAEQTQVWHRSVEQGAQRPERDPEFDFDQIHELVQTVEEHNAAWRAWFASVGITPYTVWYEDLDADPVGVAGEILGFLGLELPPGQLIHARNRRLADELNARWMNRYRAKLTGRK